MKSLSLFLLLFLVFFSHSAAQSDKATVYLIRSVGPDNYIPYYIYMDQKIVCSLRNGQYSKHQLEPGTHTFHAQYKGKVKSNPETDLSIDLEAGKIYYIAIEIKTKAFGKGSFHCEPISEEEGQKRLENFYFNQKCF
ncbi:MAG: DUF2846 domain-containing protein [Algoriphagus sp.]|jgi:hypothetical protein|nr:DUF2846 domain-containing protein [Algoriphagus sp.]